MVSNGSESNGVSITHAPTPGQTVREQLASLTDKSAGATKELEMPKPSPVSNVPMQDVKGIKKLEASLAEVPEGEDEISQALSNSASRSRRNCWLQGDLLANDSTKHVPHWRDHGSARRTRRQL